MYDYPVSSQALHKRPGDKAPAKRGPKAARPTDRNTFFKAGMQSARGNGGGVYPSMPESPGPNAPRKDWDRHFKAVEAMRERGPDATVDTKGTVRRRGTRSVYGS